MATRASQRSRRLASNDGDEAQAKPWWHLFLVYPALGVALITAAPQWFDKVGAAVKGVNAGSLAAAERQNALWRRNLSCMAAPGAWTKYDNGVEIDATVCNSGDIFVQAKAAGATKANMYWVAVEDVLKENSKGNSLISPASAATLAQFSPARPELRAGQLFHRAQFTVLCQNFIDARYIRRRISTPNGCYDEIIDSYNGQVVRTVPAPCTPQC